MENVRALFFKNATVVKSRVAGEKSKQRAQTGVEKDTSALSRLLDPPEKDK